MPIPKEVMDVYNDPAAIKVLATRSGEDLHVIPLGSMRVVDSNTIVCATIFMHEAHENSARQPRTMRGSPPWQ